MSDDPYLRNRTFYEDISGDFTVETTQDDLVIKDGKVNETIFIQKVHVSITTASGGKTWQLTDDANPTPKQIAGPFATDTDGAHYDRDYGAKGVPLGEGQGLKLDVSAAGAGGLVVWEGYRKLTGVAAPA